MNRNKITTLPVSILLKNGAKIPEYALTASSGVDLHACLEAPIVLEPGQRQLVPTGLTMIIPEGYEAQIRPRSGLAFNHGITVLNTPGTIDAGYRGELKILLIHLGQEPFVIEPNMRVAQCVFAPVCQVAFQVVDSLDIEASDRQAGGFGSTGMR